MKRILIIGASGMLGNTLLRYFSNESAYETYGTIRTSGSGNNHLRNVSAKLISGVDINSFDTIIDAFSEAMPDVVVNCVGLVKQLKTSDSPLSALPINSLFPHRLAKLCSVNNSRLIHMSTDCVFSGSKGMYSELDVPDAVDLYGVSKRLGEVDYPNSITLRTSIIGHELNGNRSLIDWFLSQEDSVSGYSQAIFSGLPTVEIGRIINLYVIPNADLRGLYHVSADPINKYDLLSLVANIYNKNIHIIRDGSLKIDRSLDSSRFRMATGFNPSPWADMIRSMNEFK